MNCSSARLVLVAFLPMLSSAGCCTLAELFCGPDRSRWVNQSYLSPRAALETFMEAVRREDTLVIYRCLGEGFKARFQLGVLELAVAWEKVKEQVPFGAVHLLGTAAIVGPEQVEPDRVRFELERAGQVVVVELVRQPYWEVTWDDEDWIDGEYVASLQRIARVEPAADGNAISVRVSSTLPEQRMTLDRIRRVAIGYDWKIDGFRPAPDE